MDNEKKDLQQMPAPETHIDEKDRAGTLDDESRIKVLSPSMLVAKRFFRNRLAVVGLCIIAFMFVFAFVGGWVSPYGQAEQFYKDELFSQEYAAVTYNTDFRYTVTEGEEFGSVAKSKFILAATRGEATCVYKNVTYGIMALSDNSYLIEKGTFVAQLMGGSFVGEVPADIESAYRTAAAAGKAFFTLNGTNYYVGADGKNSALYSGENFAVASKYIFAMYDDANTMSYDFRYNAELAIANADAGFTAGGVEYELEELGEGVYTIWTGSGDERAEYVSVSSFVVQAYSSDIVISMDFRETIEAAIGDGLSSFVYTDAEGVEQEFTIDRKNLNYIVRKDSVTRLYDMYAYPTWQHWLGTDSAGMDVLTRLMHGGRVSLIIGFVVVIIEVLLGVIMGGISGYFGGWIDTIVMRLVEVFYCIPSTALLIIIGSVMDQMKVESMTRLMFLMMIMGFLGWASVARLVRGQILSLREQEFMVATEASGLSVQRRIFSHLIPNVIPQLIVTATMGLGGVILTESTLSFLGLGVKFPFASWGNIINDVNNVYVLTNYWFVWIPAGLLIVVTVLGFNFIGDGLRDAFDPKMKR